MNETAEHFLIYLFNTASNESFILYICLNDWNASQKQLIISLAQEGKSKSEYFKCYLFLQYLLHVSFGHLHES